MPRENIMFFENNDESYTIVDLYLDYNRFFGHKGSYNYHDIDLMKYYYLKKVVMNILLDIMM